MQDALFDLNSTLLAVSFSIRTPLLHLVLKSALPVPLSVAFVQLRCLAPHLHTKGIRVLQSTHFVLVALKDLYGPVLSQEVLRNCKS